MDRKSLPAEEHAIELVRAELKRNVSGAWVCTVVVAVFAFIEIQVYVTTDVRQFASWTLVIWTLVIMFSFVPLILVGALVMAWHLVSRDRKRLTQLQAMASAVSSGEQPGVWPPPPRATE